MGTTDETGASAPVSATARAGLDGLTCGLALSGGGIRSATFCFGLLRALARNKLLARFGFLSTVSGGGYIGAALGRLYQKGQDGAAVQKRFGSDDTLLLWWLRSNGRYLTPAGARDLGQAFASILRGVLSTHFEVAVLMLLAAAFLLSPYVVMEAFPALPAPFWASAGSVWWCLLPLPVFAGCHFIFRYWFCRDRPGQMAGDVVVAALGAAVGVLLIQSTVSGLAPGGVPWAAALTLLGAALLFSPLTAMALRLVENRNPALVPQQRLRHTKRLALALWCLLAFAVLGLLDLAAWWLARQFLREGHPWSWLSQASLALPPGLVVVARLVMPALQRWLARLQTRPVKTELLLNAVGLVLLLLVALAWLTAFHTMVRFDLVWRWLPGGDVAARQLNVLHWAVIGGLCAVYVWSTGKDLAVLNLSSLHNFYRARIERAYVSTGNYAPGDAAGAPGFRFAGGSPLNPVTRAATEQVARLIEAVEGDDVDLASYQPQQHGGPVHLITCCINQSVDDRTGNYNADRKGIALTVSSLGVETGTALPTPPDKLPVPGKLSRWVAVSGAAASSGMGSQTSPGLAALLFLSGLRLGYWTEKLLLPRQASRPQALPTADRQRRSMAMRFPKPALLLAELLARFPGLRSTAWYVSDGGHFENTGVYALLKRELDLIVVADCGADPDYTFGDLENMARKAEIDYGARIEFIDPAGLVHTDAALRAFYACVGSCKAFAGQAGPECFLLARIHYARRKLPGLLVVLKPRMLPGMPLEIAGYAARHPSFPQQPTGDQFFDEEQWEAYHQLGVRLGEKLTEPVVAALCAEAVE